MKRRQQKQRRRRRRLRKKRTGIRPLEILSDHSICSAAAAEAKKSLRSGFYFFFLFLVAVAPKGPSNVFKKNLHFGCCCCCFLLRTFLPSPVEATLPSTVNFTDIIIITITESENEVSVRHSFLPHIFFPSLLFREIHYDEMDARITRSPRLPP